MVPGHPTRDTVIPEGYGAMKEQQTSLFKMVESARVPGMGPGESYTGLFGDVCTARWLLVKIP